MTEEFRAGGRVRPKWHVIQEFSPRARTMSPHGGAKVFMTPVVLIFFCPCGVKADFDPTHTGWMVCQYCGRTNFIDTGFQVQ